MSVPARKFTALAKAIFADVKRMSPTFPIHERLDDERDGLPRQRRCATVVRMTAISIHELHENTALWVSKATEQEPIVLTDKGQAVAKIVPLPLTKADNPFLTRKLLPGFAELQGKLYGGTDSTQIISEMRDGR